MLSSQGEPLTGVSVVIKGTSQGTASNIDGWYRTEAPLGAVLVYSFVGFASYEITVSAGNSTIPGAAATIPPPGTGKKNKTKGTKIQNSRSLPAADGGGTETGVAVLSDSSAAYEVLGRYSYHRNRIHGPISRIRWSKKRGKLVLIPSYIADNRTPRYSIEFTTANSSSIINKLPLLQSQYAQGRNIDGELVVRRPEAGEPFSWGPAINGLAYNPNGDLVPSQPGLQPAQVFNPYETFRKGFATDNHLQLYASMGNYTFRTGFANKFSTGTLPLNNYQRHAIDFSLNTQWGSFHPRMYVSYAGAKERLPLRGANGASILGSLYTTPPTFDLMNGVAGSRQWKNPVTYLSPDGKQRSFAPGQADHPYWLLNSLPDQQEEQKALYGLELAYREYGSFEAQFNLVLDKKEGFSHFGLPPLAVGAAAVDTAPSRLTDRRLSTTALNSNLTVNYNLDHYSSNWDAEFLAGHNFTYLQEELNRTDGAGFGLEDIYRLEEAPEKQQLLLNPFRRTHELVTKGLFYWNGSVGNRWRIAQMALSNRMYFSNTLAPHNKLYFLPALSLSFNLHQLDLFKSSGLFSQLKTYASYANTIQEAPLLYNQWHFNSLQYAPESYRQYYELEELYHQPGLLPEKQQKWEAGLDTWLFGSRINLNANYFLNITDQLLVPVYREGRYQLENSAKLVTPGLGIALKMQGHFSEGMWEAGTTFSRSRPYVKELYREHERLPIAGLSTISTNLIAGHPYGVLWGSRFSRNEEGQLVIGADGFPLVDKEPGIVGNPTPDWLASLWGRTNWNGFGFSFVLDVKKGGEVWNGTQQFLNYYGRSQYTADYRGVIDYIFTGVNEEGAPNQQPVDFYNPANALEENRWVRYGMAGVAEEAVEEASWLRLNEVQCSYQLKHTTAKRLHLQGLKVSVMARNLFVLTNYSGIDPVSNLFGYQQAAGLDLFNQPNVKSYGFSLTLNL